MTRAPRSASWRVANGAATACSIDTTVTLSRGSGMNAYLIDSERAQRASHANGARVAKQRARERVGGVRAVKPLGSIRPWQTQHVFGHVGEDHVRRDRRDLVQLRLAKL